MKGGMVAGQDTLGIGGPPTAPLELVQIPPDIADFTGRETVASELVAKLEGVEARTSPVPVVAVSGKGGIGKTALAIHVAHRAGPSFPDGRLYVDLRGYNPDRMQRVTPADALAGFLRDLGVDGAHIPTDLHERARLFRTRLANKRYLVVLDNASGEVQVRDLLPGSPGCSVLITSRAHLGGLPGARHVPLTALSQEASINLLSEIAGPERISTERSEAEEIARFCGYLPLALRIIGARLASRPAERLSRLCERLRDERRRLDEMQYHDLEVRTSFQLSYDEMEPEPQRAFELLGLLRIPTVPSWVVAALLGRPLNEGERLVNSLVDFQLLEIAGEDAAGQTRYRFHDLVRLVAQELAKTLPADEGNAALQRVLTGYLVLADEADSALQPGGVYRTRVSLTGWPPEPIRLTDLGVHDPLAWFTAELTSLVAVSQRASEEQLWQTVWELTSTVSEFLELRAHWTEWEIISTLGHAAAAHLGSAHHLAQVQRGLGDLRRDQGRFDEALDLLNACIPVLHGEDRPAEAAATRSLGNVYRQQFRWNQAYEYFANCLRIYEELGDRRGQALSEHDLGVALRNQGRWDDAIDHFQRCLDVVQELGDRRSEAHVLRSLAVAYRNQGRWREARAHIAQCLPIFETIGDRRGWAYALAPLSDVYREQGAYDQALQLLDRCLLVRRQLGDSRWEAATNRSIGVIYRLQGRLEAATTLLDECLAKFRELGEDRLAAYTLTGLGEVYGDLGHTEKALKSFAASLRVLCALPDRLWEAKTRLSRGIVLRSAADERAALSEFDLALEIFTDLGAPEANRAADLIGG